MSQKLIFAIALAGAVVTTASVTSRAVKGASASPASYTLVCKGGTGMRAHFKDSSGNWYLEFTFGRAPAAASVNQPGEGQAAWVDRPLDPGEPTKMIFDIGSTRAWLEIASSFTRIEGWYGDKRRDVEYLINALKRSELFYVQARLNPRGSAFIIDRVGP